VGRQAGWWRASWSRIPRPSSSTSTLGASRPPSISPTMYRGGVPQENAPPSDPAVGPCLWRFLMSEVTLHISDGSSTSTLCASRLGLWLGVWVVQGYLAHQKPPPPQLLQLCTSGMVHGLPVEGGMCKTKMSRGISGMFTRVYPGKHNETLFKEFLWQ